MTSTDFRPTRAMILAAGRGERMLPLTETKPKPLIPVRGRSLLDRILDRLHDFGIEEVVVNHHHLGQQIVEHLQKRSDFAIQFSPETELLETGGGVAQALPLLGSEPFLVINGDVLWLDGSTPSLERLSAAWDGDAMDALLLMQPTVSAFGYDGDGDFFLEPHGQLHRRGEARVAPFIFAGVQILSPTLFDGVAVEPFSLNRLYDRALEAERLFGVRHDGVWFHIGTPDGLAEAEAALLRDFDVPAAP